MLYQASTKWFFTHGFETILVIAILFSLIGYGLGYILWHHYQCQIKRILKINAKLNDKKILLKEHLGKLETIIERNK